MLFEIIKKHKDKFLVGGFILLGLSLVLNLLGLLTPHWITSGTVGSGLFATCDNIGLISELKCTWVEMNHGTMQKGYMSTCRDLMSAGCALLLVCAAGSIIVCCNWQRRGACCTLAMAIACLAAAILTLVTLIIFGTNNSESISSSGSSLGYSFYLTLVNIIISTMTFCAFLATAKGLYRGNPYVVTQEQGIPNATSELDELNGNGVHSVSNGQTESNGVTNTSFIDET